VLVTLAALAGCTAEPDPAPVRPHLGVRRDAIRPTDEAALFHFDADSEVRSHPSTGERVRVHYATAGRHRTLLDDVDNDGVPDFVQLVAQTTEEVLAFWERRGLRPPTSEAELGVRDNGGDERFDVYLVDFDVSADGYFGVDACTAAGPYRCSGHMVMENDFEEQGYPNLQVAVGILASHELFHAIAAAYDGDVPVWWNEAMAVWAEEEFDPSQQDFEAFLRGFFERPDRSLDAPLPGPVDPFSYGLAIFPRFLSERWEPDVVREVLEALEDGAGGDPDPTPVDALDRVLLQRVEGGLSAAYGEFARWNLFTSTRADPERSYAQGRSYPTVALEAWETLPYEDSFRLFHLASVYLSLSPGDREQVVASLEGVDGSELQLALLEVLQDGSPGTLVVHGPAEGPSPALTVSPGARRVMVLASNLSLAGRSVRPVLCAGSPEEVAECRRRQGAGPSLDAGVGPSDGGPAERDGAPPAADADPAPEPDSEVPDGGTLTEPDSGLLDAGVEPERDAAEAGPDEGSDPAAGDDAGGCSLGGVATGAARRVRALAHVLGTALLRPRLSAPTARGGARQ